ncbi:hypothetical protein Tco_0915068 [Tanacetum coccineum]
MSKDLYEFIPTLDAVKGALVVAKSWLTKSTPILVYDLSLMPVPNSLLRVDTLKILVSESMVLEILLKAWSLLEDMEVDEKRFVDAKAELADLRATFDESERVGMLNMINERHIFFEVVSENKPIKYKISLAKSGIKAKGNTKVR